MADKKRKISKKTEISKKVGVSQKTKVKQNVKQIVKIVNPVKRVYSKGKSSAKAPTPSPVFIPQYLPQPSQSGLSVADVLGLIKQERAVPNAPELKAGIANVVGGSLPLNIPLPKKEFIPLPMEEAIPITIPKPKKINIIRPLPVEEAIPSIAPIPKKISPIQRKTPLPLEETPTDITPYRPPEIPFDLFSEQTPSLFSGIPPEEDIIYFKEPKKRSPEMTIEEALKIISDDTGEPMNVVKRRYAEDAKKEKKGNIGKWRKKAKDIIFRKGIESL
jgi:hypothetical protein